MEKEYKQAKSGDVIVLEQGDYIEGIYKGHEESRNFPGSYAFKVEQPDGLKVVFVSKMVVDLIASNSIMVGQQIKLVYKGMKENEARTREYKVYDLFFI